MARLPFFEQLLDQADRMHVRLMGGDLKAQLRIAQRQADLRELERLERLKQQAEEQIDLPMVPPEQTRLGTADDPPPQRGKRSHGPAQMSLNICGAAFAYGLSDEPYDESWSPGELGRRIADYAVKHGLEGAQAMHAAADDSTMRAFMTVSQKAIRRTRGR